MWCSLPVWCIAAKLQSFHVCFITVNYVSVMTVNFARPVCLAVPVVCSVELCLSHCSCVLSLIFFSCNGLLVLYGAKWSRLLGMVGVGWGVSLFIHVCTCRCMGIIRYETINRGPVCVRIQNIKHAL
jgi:hypothetical protein